MDTLRLVLRKLAGGVPLVLGVTLISFVLMVYYGPDLTYTLLSKNPTAEDIERVRAQLGYDQPFWWRYPRLPARTDHAGLRPLVQLR